MAPIRSLLALAATSFVTFAASICFAAPRTVCYQVQLRDERTDCPTGTGADIKRPCNPAGNYSDFVGGLIELWDKDPSGNPDDFIGSYRISDTGTRCVTFEWENAAYGAGEANPDVFVKVKYQSKGPSGSATARATDDSLVEPTPVSFRDVVWADDCVGTCYMPNLLWISSDPASVVSQRFMALDSAQRVLQMYSSILDPSFINIRYPAGSYCPGAGSLSQTEICLQAGFGSDGDTVTHELGHNVQKQMFDRDDLNSVLVGGSWTMGTTSFETDSGATTEGWAAYVGAVAWYNPDNASTNPFYSGVAIETAQPAQGVCADNRNLPRQVAKAFWDLDDANNEGASAPALYGDAVSYTTLSIAQVWANFPDGTGNGQDFESGNNGVNVQDYYYRGTLDFNRAVSLMHHNCLDAQDSSGW